MHRRNRYWKRPDFKQLAKEYPELVEYLKGTSFYFESERAIRLLTTVLLKKDFDLNIDLPEHNLCPTLANRLDYLHLIEDLLESSGINYRDDSITGLDIGTGASCIYPLLGCRLHPNWKFVATEIASDSIIVAQDNVLQNQLSDQIRLYKIADDSSPLMKPFDDILSIDFCMCNPPFYSSEEEIREKRIIKETLPSAKSRYTTSESVYHAGGEVAFVKRIIEESLQYRSRCRWFTSLLGLKSSVNILQDVLEEYNTSLIKVMSSQVGNTKRWVLAWSFLPPNRKRTLLLKGACKVIEIVLEQAPEMNLILDLFNTLLIEKTSASSYQTTYKTWARNVRRKMAAGEPTEMEKLQMKFDMVILGRTVEMKLLEGSPLVFDSLTNHLRVRLMSQYGNKHCFPSKQQIPS